MVMSNYSDTNKADGPQKQEARKKHAKTRRKPRKITDTYLHNAGLYYLERFASSSANFKDVMLRKVKRSCMAHPDQNYETCRALVDDLVANFVRLGLLDDAAYTRSKIISLRRKGKSARAIQGYLKSKGIGNDLIKGILATFDAEHFESPQDAEFQTALKFARKKRIGPFKGAKESDIQKDLGRLARAGFSYDTARRVLDIEDSEELDLINLQSF